MVAGFLIPTPPDRQAPARRLAGMAVQIGHWAYRVPVGPANLKALTLLDGRDESLQLRALAVDRLLGLGPQISERNQAVSAGVVKAPTPFRDIAPSVRLRRGRQIVDLFEDESDQ